MKLSVQSLSKIFEHSHRESTLALEDLTFDVKAGEFLCLLGPSGCGKTTLLHIIAGLEQADSGSVLLDGKLITGPGRDRVVIFQEPALFPWLNVMDNVSFGLDCAGIPKKDQPKKALEYLRLVGLNSFRKAYTHELSGGMKQRVALARALALEPDVLLMDEPFAALDAQTRDMLHTELQEIWQKTGTTILFVTHNVREAFVLGDRVLLLSARPGRLKKVFKCELPRPRHIEDFALVEAVREVLSDLREEVLAAKQKEQDHENLVG
ncbi:MAG: ABC transporter ATP-binding protein [Anaerolineales bacterium]|nr:ABC transporter ATP-binding protein [Anaerolineales bacterium]